MIERVERELGRPVKVRVAGKTLLRVIGLFNPLMRELVDMNYLMTEPVIMDDSALHELLGSIAKTSYDDGVHAIIAARRASEIVGASPR